MALRIGIGYDVHQLIENRPLILGGVTIPFDKGLLGHSDADVLTHAVIDALLGAAAMGDIGRHFPDTDPQYKNISSMALLAEVRAKLAAAGYSIHNIDATIIAQKPKLATFFPAITANFIHVLQIPPDAVNIKATTEEGLGFTGTGQGMAAHAVCLIESRRTVHL